MGAKENGFPRIISRRKMTKDANAAIVNIANIYDINLFVDVEIETISFQSF